MVAMVTGSSGQQQWHRRGPNRERNTTEVALLCVCVCVCWGAGETGVFILRNPRIIHSTKVYGAFAL